MNVHILIAVIISVIVSFLSVQWVYFKVLKIAKEKKLVDNPDARKLQRTPIPVVGGIAIFFGLTFGLLACADLAPCRQTAVDALPIAPLGGVIFGA